MVSELMNEKEEKVTKLEEDVILHKETIAELKETIL